MLGSVSLAQEKANPKKDPPGEKAEPPKGKVRGFLPANWGKIGLTDEQKQKVYLIQNQYGEQIEKLELQIQQLKDKMSKERFDVLTDNQKARLKEILDSKSGGK